ncbi:MAG: hypothetical protein Ct9H300mP23_07440 [Nitrospinota bacterium]|nr:MAG: hypothetical protein Ct9H300mP23_07440 [Nitrospinota bacterium]
MFLLSRSKGLWLNRNSNSEYRRACVHKCQQAYDSLKCPVLVEDSGPLFNAWDGLPGPFIKWFECTVGCEGMLKMLQRLKTEVRFRFPVLQFLMVKILKKREERLKGALQTQIRGSKGFGWDVFFFTRRLRKNLRGDAVRRKKFYVT